MKQKTSFLLLLLINCFFTLSAQNLLVQYEYRSREKLSSSNILENYTYLKIENLQSFFFSEGVYLSDSIIANSKKNNTDVDFKSLPYDPLGCVIVKDYSKDKIKYYSYEFDDKEFIYEEAPDFKWQIENEEKKILNYDCKVAKTSYGGRNYTAYFTSEIPIQDGPYKFKGLPGLILEIFDEKMDHHFLVTGLLKNKEMDIENVLSRRKYVVTTKEKFLRFRESYAAAPLQRAIDLMHSTQIYEMKDKSGNDVDLRKLFYDAQKTMIDAYKNENKIEL